MSEVLHKVGTWERTNRGMPDNERQRKVINRLRAGFEGRFSTSKFAKLVNCSIHTALRDIKFLLDQGILIQEVGGGRSTSNRLTEA